MKKYFAAAVVFALGLIALPGAASAQWNPHIYSNNAYLSYALAKKKARKSQRRAAKKKSAAKSRNVPRKRARVSFNENLIDPKSGPAGLAPKKSLVV